MNRRKFTASLGALSGAAALPIPALALPAPTLSAVPTATYSWAKLIVRAQAKADPAMLARHLKLTPEAANNLLHMLIRDGVLRTPAATGIAQAVHRVQASGQSIRTTKTVQDHLKATWERFHEDAEPLVNQESPALGCDNNVEKDCSDAHTDEPVQESSQAG